MLLTVTGFRDATGRTGVIDAAAPRDAKELRGVATFNGTFDLETGTMDLDASAALDASAMEFDGVGLAGGAFATPVGATAGAEIAAVACVE